MFKELGPLLRQRTVVLILTRLEDDTIRVNVIPRKLNESENDALTTPLSVAGTAEELDAELARGDRAKAAEELGDVLFNCANIARALDIDPESALRATNAKFARRFAFIEAALADSNGKVAGPNGAAAKLGIPRSTLDLKIKQLNIKKHTIL